MGNGNIGEVSTATEDIKHKWEFGYSIGTAPIKVKRGKGLSKLPKITVILLNYERPENYKELVNRLIGQIGVDVDIWVWDSGLNLPNQKNIKIFRDPINPGIFIRWELARFAKGEYILFIDDDVFPLDSAVLKDTIKAREKYPPNVVVGWKGVRVDTDYRSGKHIHSKHIKEDTKVHFCKGNFMLFRQDQLKDLKGFPPELLEIDERAHGEFWYELQMGKCEPVHRVIKCLEGRLDNNHSNGKGLEFRKDHYDKQPKHYHKCLELLKCSQ